MLKMLNGLIDKEGIVGDIALHLYDTWMAIASLRYIVGRIYCAWFGHKWETFLKPSQIPKGTDPESIKVWMVLCSRCMDSLAYTETSSYGTGDATIVEYEAPNEPDA